MSIFSCLRYCLSHPNDLHNLWISMGFIPFGLFFDFMDGKVARWRKKSSLMGQELDSLADLVGNTSLQLLSPASITNRQIYRSLSAWHLLLVHFLLVFALPLTLLFSPTLFSAVFPVSHVSMSLRHQSQKIPVGKASTLRGPQYPLHCL